MDHAHDKPHNNEDVALLDEFDSANDGSMSDVEGDDEAFYAVFPHAPTLAKQHALRPLVDAWRTLLARPAHLVAAILPRDAAPSVQTLDALEHKSRLYTRAQLHAILSTEDWTRATEFLQSRSTDHDCWTSPQLVQQVDDMILKLTLYYASLWKYTCVAAMHHVFRVETTVASLYDEWTSGQHVERVLPKLPALETVYRPLRLRSQTAAAKVTAGPTNPPVEAPADDANNSTADKAAAFRRARLARKSNEFLIAWFLHHKAKPYPSQTERAQIAKKTGLTEQQVRNWFANMRKRHWKPKDDKKTKKPRCLLDTLLRQNEATATA